jgi:hypothetical protein
VQRISIHIERLLLDNDCVVIPGFGGFVLHPCSAVYQSDVHKFCPPYKEIVFNPTLIHQDGLLPESYIQMYGMTFNQAQNALKKDVAALHNQIDKAGEIYLDKIGFLKKGDDGKVFFEPDSDSSFLGLRPYGLYAFHLPPVPRDTRDETTEVVMTQAKTKFDNVVYLPVNRALIRAVGVSVAAACLILFVSLPLKEVDRGSYSASIIPCERDIRNEYMPSFQIDTAQIAGMEIDVEKEVVVSNELIQPVVEGIIQPVVAEIPPVVQTEMQNQKIYYAIIGSFVAEKQANQFMQDIKMPELTNMGIVINDGRVRVFAGKFDNRKEAESYIQLLRANIKLKDTWLFVGNGSQIQK